MCLHSVQLLLPVHSKMTDYMLEHVCIIIIQMKPRKSYTGTRALMSSIVKISFNTLFVVVTLILPLYVHVCLFFARISLWNDPFLSWSWLWWVLVLPPGYCVASWGGGKHQCPAPGAVDQAPELFLAKSTNALALSSWSSEMPVMRRLLRRPYCSKASFCSRRWRTSPWSSSIVAPRSATLSLRVRNWACRPEMLWTMFLLAAVKGWVTW